MKLKLSILFLFCIIYTQAQEESEIRDAFWGSSDAYKNANSIPDKWKNESAVIIYKNINYGYKKFGKNVTYKTSYRTRIKLLDKNAVEEYSEFSFKKSFRSDKVNRYRNKKGKVYFALKIIKEDGKEIEVDVNKDAVKKDDGYKIAVSNLEVNDIIDYYYYTIEPFKSKFGYSFDPEERVLSSIYPIMDYKLRIESQNDFFINFKSLNGASELKKVPSNEKNVRAYELVANNIAKSDFPIWHYPLLEAPAIKFQVYFARKNSHEDNIRDFLSEEESIIKTNVTKEEVLDLYKNRIYPAGSGSFKYFKKRVFKTDAEKVKAHYYYMRHIYLTKYVELFIAQDAKIISSYDNVYHYPTVIQNDLDFTKRFIAFLKENKISYDIIIGTKRYNGNIKDLLIEDNVEFMVKVNTKEPLYAQLFGPHTSINQIKPHLQGTDSYSLVSGKKYKIRTVKKDKTPHSNYLKNKVDKKIIVELNEDITSFSVNMHTSYTGYTKHAEQFDRLFFYDYVYEDYKKYETKKLEDKLKTKKRRAKFNKEFSAVTSKYKDIQKKKFKKNAKDEFNLNKIEDYTYNLKNTGRFGLEDVLSYDESYTFKDQFIKKAGPNYIIEIGKFIGGQITIKEEKRKRNVGVYMKYPRMFDYEIQLKIPEGYTIIGLDKLTKNIDNSTGAFISSANIDGKTLTINTSKQYKHNYEPKENWDLMLAFLDEASQFKNEKILLKKVN